MTAFEKIGVNPGMSKVEVSTDNGWVAEDDGWMVPLAALSAAEEGPTEVLLDAAVFAEVVGFIVEAALSAAFVRADAMAE